MSKYENQSLTGCGHYQTILDVNPPSSFHASPLNHIS